jgi:hypothetical protein
MGKSENGMLKYETVTSGELLVVTRRALQRNLIVKR